MTDRQPIATAIGQSPLAALRDTAVWTAALAVGTGATVGVRFLGANASTTDAVVAGVVAAAVALGSLAASRWYRTTAELRFYRDELTARRGGGTLSRSSTVAYEDIDLVVGRGERGGVGSYELIRSGDDPVHVRRVTDPETVERALAERVPSPRGRNGEAATDDGIDRPIEHERLFWRRWPSSEPLPESPVIGASALPASAIEEDVSVPDGRPSGGASGQVEGEWSPEELALGAHTDSDPTAASIHHEQTSGGSFEGGGGDGGI